MTETSTRLRGFVIGAGRRGWAHARAALSTQQVDLVAVSDVDADRAEQLGRDLGPRVYMDVAEALTVERPDVVYVTSPPPVHAAQTLAALEAGCHVILEKPISLDLAEAAEIGCAANRVGRWVHVCQQQRYSPVTDTARDLLAGRRVALVRGHLYRQMPDIRGNWDRAWGGGHVVEWGIHYLDLCRYLIGEVDSVFAAYGVQVLAGREGWNNWDAYAVTLRWANGAVGTLSTTYAGWPGLPESSGLDIIAEDLVLQWRGKTLVAHRPGETATYYDAGDATAHLHGAFYRAILSGDPSGLRLSYPDAMGSLALVLACNHSQESGGPVRPAELLTPL